MAKTVGDLFIRVTAKDQQFKKQMRSVRHTIGGVGTSVARMAGLFGVAFGAGAAISFAMKSASKYSGVFVRQMSKLRVDMLRIEIAMGKAFGPVFAELIEDFREWAGLTGEGETNLSDAAENMRSLIRIAEAVYYWFNLIYKIGEALGGLFLKLAEAMGLMEYSADQKAMGKGMTREELNTAQGQFMDLPDRRFNPYQDQQKISSQMEAVLLRIEQNTRGPR
tara:strand:- start:301 stop:966 length:666 start_codon:yes stop_codon:yes gene_type:complete